MMRSEEIHWDSFYGPGSIDAFRRFEERAMVVLPASYRNIAVAFDAAEPENRFVIGYRGPFSAKPRVVGLPTLFSYMNNEAPGSEAEIFHYLDHPPEGFPAGLIAFGATGGGDLFCFDYRADPSTLDPPVCIWHHEAEDTNPLAVVRLGESFDDFLSKCYLDEED